LSLNETDAAAAHNNPNNHKHSEHQGHIKLNYVRDVVEQNKDYDLRDDELKVEEVDNKKNHLDKAAASAARNFENPDRNQK